MKFKNFYRHTVQVSGPNKESIKFMPGQTIELSEYYLKYVPRYIKVIDFIPQKLITSKIGVGILSCNRLGCIKRLLESIDKFNKENIDIFVSDESTDESVKKYLKNIDWIKLIDNKQRMGVVHNTNKLLKKLKPYKHKLVLNDDVEIKAPGWENFYFDIMEKTNFHHFCYRQDGLYGASKNDGTIKICNGITIKTILSKPQGAVLAFDDVAFSTVGYYDTSFPRYGMAHVDWSNRISNSKIQPPGFHDVNGSEKFFVIHNENSVEKQKLQMLREAKARYEKVKNDKKRIYIPLNLKEPLSIIMTAYETENYIEEALDSIKNQSYFKNFNEYEILVGIDSCQKTLDKLVQIRDKYNNLRIFMMDKNVGTYITSNTLLTLCQYNNIIRFDSDDIMMPNLIDVVLNKLADYDMVRFKYLEFSNDVKNAKKRRRPQHAHGVVAYHRHILDKVGGYKSWKCSADSDFINRVEECFTICLINNELFYRRIHDKSLTHLPETCQTSKLRTYYRSLLKSHYEDHEIYIRPEICTFEEIT